MGKISPVSIKYNIVANIDLTSIADKSDVIGAIFGQTEGLLGSSLELRELQKTGKIGRIQVNLKANKGKSSGKIIVPSSMGKSETAIIAASLETIDRVGPCNAKIEVSRIEDVRISKRDFIMNRAKELLKNLVTTLPDSQEFTNQVTKAVRTREITEYGEDKLPAGPLLDDEEEIYVVEGRADVLNLLKYGIRNVIGADGTKSFKTLKKLSEEKVLILFVDGDRGGDLMIRKLVDMIDIDFVCRAPDGKEVEELTLKEIQKALRAKLSPEEFEEATEKKANSLSAKGNSRSNYKSNKSSSSKRSSTSKSNYSNVRVPEIIRKNSSEIKKFSEELIGTRGAYMLDEAMNILGKVPVKEIPETIPDLSGEVFIIIMDGDLSKDVLDATYKHKVKYIVSNDKSKEKERRVILAENL